MRESIYTGRVRDDLKNSGIYALKLSLPYTAGVADSWYSGIGGDLWVEYKWYATLPLTIDLTVGKKPKLSRLQQEWLSGRLREGRRVAVVVACGHGAVVFENEEWLYPMSRTKFVARCLQRSCITAWIKNQCGANRVDSRGDSRTDGFLALQGELLTH